MVQAEACDDPGMRVPGRDTVKKTVCRGQRGMVMVKTQPKAFIISQPVEGQRGNT